ncbi:MAG: hypothetical protein IJF18_04055 [Oscillospiraceae bacterium]|nr:hypothetical protein [Oscillospiraceae bacterium]
MNIKKITVAVMAVTILAGMTACSDTANETAEVSETTTVAEETTTTVAETTAVTEETTTEAVTEEATATEPAISFSLATYGTDFETAVKEIGAEVPTENYNRIMAEIFTAGDETVWLGTPSRVFEFNGTPYVVATGFQLEIYNLNTYTAFSTSGASEASDMKIVVSDDDSAYLVFFTDSGNAGYETVISLPDMEAVYTNELILDENRQSGDEVIYSEEYAKYCSMNIVADLVDEYGELTKEPEKTADDINIEYSSTYEEIDSAVAEKLDEHGVLNAVKAHLAYALREASGNSGTRVEYGFAVYLGYAETSAGAYGLVVRVPEKEDMPTRIDVIDIKSVNQYGAPLFGTTLLEIPVEEVIEQGYIPGVYFYEGGSGDAEKYWYQSENGYMAMAEVGDSVPLDYTIELIEIEPIDITAEGYPCYECESCKAGEYVCDAPIDLQYK